MQNFFKVKLFVLEILGLVYFWPKISMFSTALTLKIRSRSKLCNQIISMSKCCIHTKCLHGQVIRSEDIGFNIIFWPKISFFFYCSDLENKVKVTKL